MEDFSKYIPIITVFLTAFIGLTAFIIRSIFATQKQQAILLTELKSIKKKLDGMDEKYVLRDYDEERHIELNNKIEVINHRLDKKVSRAFLDAKIDGLSQKIDNLTNLMDNKELKAKN